MPVGVSRREEEGQDVHEEEGARHYLVTMVKRVHDGTYVDGPADAHGRGLRPVARARARRPRTRGHPQAEHREVLPVDARGAPPARVRAYRSDRFTLTRSRRGARGSPRRSAPATMAPKFYVNLRNLLRAITTWARHPERRYLTQDPLGGLPKIDAAQGEEAAALRAGPDRRAIALAAASPPDDTIIRAARLLRAPARRALRLQWSDWMPTGRRTAPRAALDLPGRRSRPRRQKTPSAPSTCPSGSSRISPSTG